MATYIQGVTDYIPEVQAFQPDYNFLGNILQNKQSKYDANYKAISQTYGNLLNSQMLRKDNIEKRNEFFKVIDQDIKRISGLDLSLQQNTDAANKVFDSFYQNKDIVYDMTYTKEYQKQLQNAEAYRNCIDEKKCGGKYSDISVSALHYKAQEFINADKESAMQMSPGRFTPSVNIQQKANDLLKSIVGKDNKGGISTVTMSKDGRYQFTLSNGELIAGPLSQLLQADLENDPMVKDMYDTHAYVNRKSFVASKAKELGGNEDLAEDEYFKTLDSQNKTVQEAALKMQNEKNKASGALTAYSNQIKTSGTTGDDAVSKAFIAAGVKSSIVNKAAGVVQAHADLGTSLYSPNLDRSTKRQIADAFFAKSLMGKEISESAIRAAAVTGNVQMKEDAYALKYVDYSLDVAKMQLQYNLMDRNERNKALYELTNKQILGQADAMGTALDPLNNGEEVPYDFGSKATTDPSASIAQEKWDATKSLQGSAYTFTKEYTDQLLGIISNPSIDDSHKKVARQTLKDIYKTNYDQNTNMFVQNGNKLADYDNLLTDANVFNIYTRAAKEADANENKANEYQVGFLNGKGKQLRDGFLANSRALNLSTKIWRDNNKIVKDIKQDFESTPDKLAWQTMLTADNNKLAKSQFIPVYKAKYSSIFKREVSDSDASKAYDKMNEEYIKVYYNNSQRLQSINTLAEKNSGIGGTGTAMAIKYPFDTTKPLSGPIAGAVGFYKDTEQDGLFTIGDHGTFKDADKAKSDAAKQAFETIISDFKNGRLSTKEKREVGEMLFASNALGGDQYSALHMKLSPSLLKRYENKDEKYWSNNKDLIDNGITMYTKKGSATNIFNQKLTKKPYDLIIEHEAVPVSIPNGGYINISARDKSGNVHINGYILDDKGTRMAIAPTTYDKNVGGQQIFERMNNLLNELAQKNTQHSNATKPRSYDPNQLVQSMDGQQGTPTVEELFQRQFELNARAQQ